MLRTTSFQTRYCRLAASQHQSAVLSIQVRISQRDVFLEIRLPDLRPQNCSVGLVLKGFRSSECLPPREMLKPAAHRYGVFSIFRGPHDEWTLTSVGFSLEPELYA
jgi:hypothetical protein